MSTRTITHTSPGPVRFTLDVAAADVTVHTAPSDTTATVTLEPRVADDEVTAGVIQCTTHEHAATAFTVRVPQDGGGPGATTVVRDGHGTVRVSGGRVTGSVVGMVIGGSIDGATIVNGQVITGSGNIVIGAGGQVSVGGQGLRIVVRLPHGSSVTFTGQSADLTTRGHLEQVDANTVSGDLDIDTAAAVRLHTTSGDVHVGACPDVSTQTVSGDVRVSDLAGRATLTTVSGDIRVRAVADSTVSARSVSGDLDLEAPQGIEIDARTRTVSGRVRDRRW